MNSAFKILRQHSGYRSVQKIRAYTIERLFGFAKIRLKMAQLYTRGAAAVLGHVRMSMTVIHLIANIKGAYGF